MSSYSIWSEKTWKPCFSWWSSMNYLIRQGRCYSTNFRPTEHLTEQCDFLESTKLFWVVFLSRWKLTFQDNIYPTTGQEPSHNGWITMKTTSVSHHTTPPPPSPHGPAGIFWCSAFFLFVFATTTIITMVTWVGTGIDLNIIIIMKKKKVTTSASPFVNKTVY